VGKLVVGYYSITVGAVAKHAAPTVVSKGAPEQIACMVISRLAVDRTWQGKKIGAGLLRDALERSALLSEAVAARAVLIHAKDAEARSFFTSQLDVQPSPLNDLQLMIPMDVVQKFFGQQG
jgi:GNAT superfamily N-acetyltransferase